MNGEELKKKRLLLDLSQAEFAERLGVARKTIIGYESGKKIPEKRLGQLKVIFRDVDNIALVHASNRRVRKQLTPEQKVIKAITKHIDEVVTPLEQRVHQLSCGLDAINEIIQIDYGELTKVTKILKDLQQVKNRS